MLPGLTTTEEEILPVSARPLQSSLELGALPTAVACARLHARQVAWEWGLDSLAEMVELVVSELVTNAIKAAITQSEAEQDIAVPHISLRLTGGDGEVLVEVWDGSLEPPVRSTADPTTEGGRGLLLVEAVSANWGYYNVAPDVMPSELSAPTADWASGQYYGADAGRGPAGEGRAGGGGRDAQREQAGAAGKVVWALVRKS